MKRATFSIIFFIRRTKLLKDGTAPIYARATVNKASQEIAIKRSIDPSKWDTKKNKVKGRDSIAKEINEYLNSIKGQLFVIHRNMLFLEERNSVTLPLFSDPSSVSS